MLPADRRDGLLARHAKAERALVIFGELLATLPTLPTDTAETEPPAAGDETPQSTETITVAETESAEITTAEADLTAVGTNEPEFTASVFERPARLKWQDMGWGWMALLVGTEEVYPVIQAHIRVDTLGTGLGKSRVVFHYRVPAPGKPGYEMNHLPPVPADVLDILDMEPNTIDRLKPRIRAKVVPLQDLVEPLLIEIARNPPELSA